MITNKDVEKLKETFATKEDLKQFATKKELQSFKKEVNQKFDETNRHFDVVAEDIKNSIALLAENISAKNSKVDEHEEKIEALNTDISVLRSRVSAVETKVKN